MAECRAWVQEYLRRDAVEVAGATAAPEDGVVAHALQQTVPSDPRKVRLCFSMLRDAFCERDGETPGAPTTAVAASAKHQELQSKVATQVEHFREIIRQRDSEICNLLAGDGEGLEGRVAGGEMDAGKGDAGRAGRASSDSLQRVRPLRGFYVQL